MSDVDKGLRRFRVRARHEDIQHGRIIEEPSFEAAAVPTPSICRSTLTRDDLSASSSMISRAGTNTAS